MFLGVGTLQGPFDVNPTFYCFLYNGYGWKQKQSFSFKYINL